MRVSSLLPVCTLVILTPSPSQLSRSHSSRVPASQLALQHHVLQLASIHRPRTHRDDILDTQLAADSLQQALTNLTTREEFSRADAKLAGYMVGLRCEVSQLAHRMMSKTNSAESPGTPPLRVLRLPTDVPHTHPRTSYVQAGAVASVSSPLSSPDVYRRPRYSVHDATANLTTVATDII